MTRRFVRNRRTYLQKNSVEPPRRLFFAKFFQFRYFTFLIFFTQVLLISVLYFFYVPLIRYFTFSTRSRGGEPASATRTVTQSSARRAGTV